MVCLKRNDIFLFVSCEILSPTFGVFSCIKFPRTRFSPLTKLSPYFHVCHYSIHRYTSALVKYKIPIRDYIVTQNTIKERSYHKSFHLIHSVTSACSCSSFRIFQIYKLSSSTPPHCTEVPVPIQGNEWSCVCVLAI